MEGGGAIEIFCKQIVETQTKTKTKHAVRAERKEKLLMLVHHGGDGGDVDGDGGDVDGDGGDGDFGDLGDGDLHNPRLIPASACSPQQAARLPWPPFPHPPWQ